MSIELFLELKERLLELSHLNSTMAMLRWDEQVNMPRQGAIRRSQTLSYLAGLHHQKLLSLNDDGLLGKLRQAVEKNELAVEPAAVVKEVWREFDKTKKLPLDFVKEMARITSEAHGLWAEAKEKADFNHFALCLKQIIALKCQEAEYVGYKESPYDAMIDNFEPGMTSQQLTKIFQTVKPFLIHLLAKIKTSPLKIDPQILNGYFPIDQQLAFNNMVAEQMGFDFSCGCLHSSVHPFTQAVAPEDVRMTTRYNQHNLMLALLTTIHETGHALYEQGICTDYYGTPLGQIGSWGVHESQSMIWERHVGQGKAFWEFFYPLLQKEFPEPLSRVSLDDFYQTINHVNLSLIRTEADEVTYILHIILRFEIERDLMEKKITVEDLPRVWNQKIKEYLGIEVTSDAEGVLQDIHWASGYFGYFPAYALGTMYAAQIYAAAQKDLPELEKQLRHGHCQDFREWLRTKIHYHGKRYSVPELLKQATGESFNPQHFMNYLTEKYQAIYQLNNQSPKSFR